MEVHLYDTSNSEIPIHSASLDHYVFSFDAPDMNGTYTVAQHDCVLPKSGLRARLFYPCITTPNARIAEWMPASATRWMNENVRSLFEYLGVPGAWLLSFVLGWAFRVRLPWRADEPVSTERPWPVALFSHGLGSSLAGYVSVCAALASTGRIVAAMEHGDGSAHGAYIGTERRRVPYVHRPRDDDEHEQLAKRQNEQRVREFDAVMDDLRVMNSGTTSQHPLPPCDKRVEFKQRVDVDAPVVVAGHSFGGATALGYTIKSWNRATTAQVSHVICLDPWLSPVGEEVLLNTVAPDNARVLHVDQEQTGRTLSVALREDMYVPFKRVCVLGGLHNNATDFATKLPTFIAVVGRLAAQRIDPNRLMRAQNLAVMRFVGDTWGQFENDVAVGNVDCLSL